MSPCLVFLATQGLRDLMLASLCQRLQWIPLFSTRFAGAVLGRLGWVGLFPTVPHGIRGAKATRLAQSILLVLVRLFMDL